MIKKKVALSVFGVLLSGVIITVTAFALNRNENVKLSPVVSSEAHSQVTSDVDSEVTTQTQATTSAQKDEEAESPETGLAILIPDEEVESPETGYASLSDEGKQSVLEMLGAETLNILYVNGDLEQEIPEKDYLDYMKKNGYKLESKCLENKTLTGLHLVRSSLYIKDNMNCKY